MLYCPNCQCQSCVQQNQHLSQTPPGWSSWQYNYTTRTPKKTITCGWCNEEHDTFEDIQWCRRTIDERNNRTFEEAAVLVWEFLEKLDKPS